jgi:hypothetical protein
VQSQHETWLRLTVPPDPTVNLAQMRGIDITTNTHQTYNKAECSNNMAQSVESRLLALVDELQLGIIEHVESKDDLSNLAITCSRLQALAEPVLYRSILVRKGKQALLLYRAILIKPVRASFIRKLEIRYLYDYRKRIDCLNQCLRLLCKLRELTIEAPCCNDTHALLGDRLCRLFHLCFLDDARSTTQSSGAASDL